MVTKCATLEPLDCRKIDEIIEEHRGTPGELLGILERVQQEHRYKYLPKETLAYVAHRLNLSTSQVYSVATFYAFFSLQPQGDHAITICRGTACHARGSRQLLEAMKTQLKLSVPEDMEGEVPFLTTPDNRFTIRTVACFGQCAMAPVIAVDETIHGRITEQTMRQHVDRIDQGGPQP